MLRCLFTLAFCLSAAPPAARLKIDYVYTESLIHQAPGHLQRLPNLPGHKALYIFWPDGRLDTVECGQVYNFDTGRMWVDLADPLLQHGRWEKTRSATVILTLAESPRMPLPPGVAPDRRQHRYEFMLSGPARGALTERMSTLNVGLVAVKQLTNLLQLDRLLR